MVRAKASLFGKSGKPFTKYQEKINEVAGDICVKDIAMLGDKGKLLELARVKLHETGYIYSKEKSVLNLEVTKKIS